MKPKYPLLIFLIGISLFFSIQMALTPEPLFCTTEGGCDLVQSSQYASILGIRLTTYAVAIFSALIILIIYNIIKPTKKKKQIIDYSIILGGLIALILIFLQGEVIKSWCTQCLIIDIPIILGALLILFSKE